MEAVPGRIRVLYVVPTLATGGLERMAHLLATSLDKTRFDPSFQVFDFIGPLAAATTAAGVPVRFDKRGPGFLDRALLRTLAKRFQAERPHLIHAHNATALVYVAFAARLAAGMRRRVPIVYTEHDRSFPGPISDRILHIAAGRMVDSVAVVAEYLKRELVRWEKFAPRSIDVLPNGVEEDRFTAHIDPLAARATLGLTAGAPVVSCVARLAAVKNHPLLLSAWRRIADERPNATLLLAGVGPDGDALVALTGKLGLTKNVRFLGDWDDVPSVLAASDLHVLASHSEGMSLTLLEAMAAGRASVATAVGGNPEVLEHGRTGLLVPAGDVGKLASSIASLLADRALGARMGEAARETFRRRFTLGGMVRAYEALYLRTLGEREKRDEVAHDRLSQRPPQ